MEIPCLKVGKSDVEKVMDTLSRAGIFGKNYKIGRLGEFMCIPVEDVKLAVELMEGLGVRFELLELPLEPKPSKPRGLKEVSKHISSYNVIGDIVVFNWRSEIPDVDVYRDAALYLMREQPRIKAAFLKYNTWGELRVQRLVHLAGENRTKTVHKEYGLIFHVDIARVYFNPRLATEHRRIAEEALDGDIVLDMFSGVGGFSIHIANLKNSKVVAVDINPVAAALAALNVKENRRKLKGEVLVLRADAALLPRVLKPVFTRIVMNHPTLSKNYLGEACGLARPNAVIHYYTRTLNCREAEDEMLEYAGRCCGDIEFLYCRKVLEYSPSHSILNVTTIVKKS